MEIVAVLAGSLLVGALAVAALNGVLARRGQPRTRIGVAVGVALTIAALCAAFGLLALGILERSRYPWAEAAALAACGGGIFIVAALVGQVGMRVGYAALGVAVISEATGMAVTHRADDTFAAQSLLFLAVTVMIAAAAGHIALGAQERTRRMRGSPDPGIDLNATSLVAGRRLLMAACMSALVADALRLPVSSIPLVLTGASAAAALCSASSIACFIALGISSTRPVSDGEPRR